MICVFILSLQCVNPIFSIAEGKAKEVVKSTLVSKTASIQSQIETVEEQVVQQEPEVKTEDVVLQVPEVGQNTKEVVVQKIRLQEKPREVVLQVPEASASAAAEMIPQGAPFAFVTVMPTAENLTPEIKATWGKKVAGTDQWNDLILKVSNEEGIDPVFVKCIMTIESGGYQQAYSTNSNGSHDHGLMQVNTIWGTYYDLDRMLYDPEYAIRCGIQVIKAKIVSATKAGDLPTASEIFWRYNGKNEKGKRYSEKIMKLYTDLSGKTGDSYIVINN